MKKSELVSLIKECINEVDWINMDVKKKSRGSEALDKELVLDALDAMLKDRDMDMDLNVIRNLYDRIESGEFDKI